MSGIILEMMGYIPNTVQTQTALWAIRILLGLLPGILILISIMVIYHYPITKEFYQKIRHDLQIMEDGNKE